MEITITPFGVDTNVFSPLGERRLDSRYFWIGLVKKLTYKYGIDYVINAFDIFLRVDSDTDIVLTVLPELFVTTTFELDTE